MWVAQKKLLKNILLCSPETVLIRAAPSTFLENKEGGSGSVSSRTAIAYHLPTPYTSEFQTKI